MCLYLKTFELLFHVQSTQSSWYFWEITNIEEIIIDIKQSEKYLFFLYVS